MFWDLFFSSSLFPNNLLAVLNANPNLPQPHAEQKDRHSCIQRWHLVISNYRWPENKLAMPANYFQKESPQINCPKFNVLSLKGILQFNRFINKNPVQVTSFSYLGTNREFVLDKVLTVALLKARHSLVLCQDFIWLWQGSGYTNLKYS